MTENQKPIVAVPLGDPAGVGPEILVKAFATQKVQDAARCVAVGDIQCIKKALVVTESSLSVNIIEFPELGDFSSGVINVLAIDNIDMKHFAYGKVSAMCGRAAYQYIEKSVELAMQKKVDAIATTPINKESLKAGNINFIGHTEIFAKLTNTQYPITMFETHGLRIFFLTRHLSLLNACKSINKDKIINCTCRCLDMLKKLGVKDGTLAIAGLNPHSGEHGLFGDEETKEIFPAVEALRNLGFPVTGPVSADSVFHLALRGRFNSVLSLYHDQGHIAAKTLDFDRTISITGGMPVLRTSVDHGTAFDIAGINLVSEISMVEAILVAAKYAPAFSAN
ncbi:MAG: 4-hydroxythreonine-4-phosphate dehydrogenase PdxA [Spirochaetaceae bacterium]|jgi:4-hydroxythreonine-4-phosphate dehydrogenase|nr:4-hydroxythreonine-4-phosphate dehydrogenase PdxA [Spirochaetaceae bacterium]